MYQQPVVAIKHLGGARYGVAKTSFKSVNEYIASKPEKARAVLERVRSAIRKAVPAAEEGLSYQMPVYMLNGVPVLFFAGWNEHYSLYLRATRLSRRSNASLLRTNAAKAPFGCRCRNRFP